MNCYNGIVALLHRKEIRYLFCLHPSKFLLSCWIKNFLPNPVPCFPSRQLHWLHSRLFHVIWHCLFPHFPPVVHDESLMEANCSFHSVFFWIVVKCFSPYFVSSFCLSCQTFRSNEYCLLSVMICLLHWAVFFALFYILFCVLCDFILSFASTVFLLSGYFSKIVSFTSSATTLRLLKLL